MINMLQNIYKILLAEFVHKRRKHILAIATTPLCLHTLLLWSHFCFCSNFFIMTNQLCLQHYINFRWRTEANTQNWWDTHCFCKNYSNHTFTKRYSMSAQNNVSANRLLKIKFGYRFLLRCSNSQVHQACLHPGIFLVPAVKLIL